MVQSFQGPYLQGGCGLLGDTEPGCGFLLGFVLLVEQAQQLLLALRQLGYGCRQRTGRQESFGRVMWVGGFGSGAFIARVGGQELALPVTAFVLEQGAQIAIDHGLGIAGKRDFAAFVIRQDRFIEAEPGLAHGILGDGTQMWLMGGFLQEPLILGKELEHGLAVALSGSHDFFLVCQYSHL